LRCELSADVTLETGSKGAFDIRVDGRLAYSKAQTGRLPNADQVMELLRRT
jgi:selT/selW/selH-like putative selenoprotein